jgi:2-hydroxy-6-oxonona-2,4-dienedioate hydrolase
MARTRGLRLATFVIVAGTVGVALWFRNELGRARGAASRDSSIINTDAGPIEYADKGAGIPLLSLHGAGGGLDQGIANAAELVGEGFRIIAPSRFGYLRTPLPRDTSPAAQAEAHAALLSELHVARAVVLGVSAGAPSSVDLALRHPNKVAALILLVPGLFSPTNPVSIKESRGNKFTLWVVNAGGGFAWWAAEKIAPPMLIRFVSVPPAVVAAAPQAQRDRVMRIIKSIEPLSLRFRGINVDSTTQLSGLPSEKITAPTPIVSARDHLFNTLPAAQFAASGFPNAKLIVYDTGGHLLVGHDEDARTAVRTFLADLGLTPPDAAGTAVHD